MVSWRRKWQPTPIFLPGKSHGQSSLAGYSLWSHKRVRHDLLTTEKHRVYRGYWLYQYYLDHESSDTRFSNSTNNIRDTFSLSLSLCLVSLPLMLNYLGWTVHIFFFYDQYCSPNNIHWLIYLLTLFYTISYH